MCAGILTPCPSGLSTGFQQVLNILIDMAKHPLSPTPAGSAAIPYRVKIPATHHTQTVWRGRR